MQPDKSTTLTDLFPLPEGVKLRRFRFGTTPPTPAQLLPPNIMQGGTNDPPEFELTWRDTGLGLTVIVRERPDNHKLYAQVFSRDPAHLGKAAVSVALVGTKGDDMICKTVRLDTPETAGPDKCSGTDDFGPLKEARERLGDALSLTAILVV